MFESFVLLVTLFTAFQPACMSRNAGSLRQFDINEVRNVLARAMSWNGIPKDALEWFAILNKHLHLLSCLPTVKQGHCYQSQEFCEVESMKVDGRPIKVHFTVCKRPVKIIINYQVPMPTWTLLTLDVDLGPFVIQFDKRKKEGTTHIDSSSSTKVSVKGIRFGHVKVKMNINALLRWDCTKPADLIKRVNYNAKYDDGKPGYDFNKRYYKLRVRVEFKVKKFACLCYRCRKCEDLINVQGDIGEGPKKCETEITGATKWFGNGNSIRGMKVYRQRINPLSLCPIVHSKPSLGYRVYLFYFLENPKKYDPGTRLAFSGIKKKRERGDLLTFLNDKTALCLIDS